MKKTCTANQAPEPEAAMLPEYRFDYRKARPNRFAARLKRGSRAVVLDPDVATVFFDTGVRQCSPPGLDRNYAADKLALARRKR